ncbi:RNA polymerase sigma factor [Rhizobium rosettiformans]|uniref:RNA polymerase sigma factor n=1 Tax=Rhizobium rosettiformans TaxID=1368430 RepID=A0ABX7ET02_9HYPH|nr:RNA polymerase sigma factor [Rhizobium rosettiformans]
MGDIVQARQFRQLLNEARRLSRRADEAEDLLQDALLAAITAGREDFSKPENLRWLRGVLRHRSTFVARSAVRRRQQESVFVFWQPQTREPAEPNDLDRHLQRLPPGLRTTFLLALNGQTHAEIRHLLKLNEAALRQRICEIRKRLRPFEFTGAVPERLCGNLTFGSIRQSLRPLIGHVDAMLATHDPDGHLISFGRDLTKTRPAAT